MIDGDLLDPARHAGALAVAAARALRAGDFDRAHALADRRCRIRPAAEAHDFLLRAAARRALGDAAGAEADTREAAAIDPENRIAARWLLRATGTADRVRAARLVARTEGDPGVVGVALGILAEAGAPVVGCLSGQAEAVSGWMAWAGTAPLALAVTTGGETQVHLLAPQPGHRLAGPLGSAADIALPWPAHADTLEIGALPAGAVVHGTGFARPAETRVPPDRSGGRGHVTIVVPVYGDAAATRLCLETLLAAAPRRLARTIVAVGDASPDPAIVHMLDAHAAAGDLTLLRNPVNLGFAGSVNRALADLPPGDLLVLNADTVLPPGFLDRLARAAHSAPGIGTVTPLSNNGEFTSLPRPFVENPLPMAAEVRALDAVAASVNRGRLVDMPNGTGFCLYVTRACLDAVGALALQFGRGYLEDVEFCLRAAQAGFRNVCAADVYVGHAGTRSFGSEKRSLVVRNLARVEALYPGYERACAAFFAADPLAPSRAAIEWRRLDPRMAPPAPSHLVVLDESEAEAWITGHREACAGGNLRVARVGLRAGRIEMAIADPGGGFPQSLRFAEPLRRAGPRLATTLARLAPDTVELPNPGSLPDEVRRAVAALGRPGRATAPDPPPAALPPLNLARTGPERVAVMAPPGTASFQRLRALARHWATDARLPGLVVLGQTFDDLRLMGSGPILVTGPVPAPEVQHLLQRLGATRLILLDPNRPEARAALTAGLPVAILEPTRAGDDRVPGALGLDPDQPAESLAARLAAWATAPSPLQPEAERRAA